MFRHTPHISMPAQMLYPLSWFVQHLLSVDLVDLTDRPLSTSRARSSVLATALGRYSAGICELTALSGPAVVDQLLCTALRWTQQVGCWSPHVFTCHIASLMQVLCWHAPVLMALYACWHAAAMTQAKPVLQNYRTASKCGGWKAIRTACRQCALAPVLRCWLVQGRMELPSSGSEGGSLCKLSS